MPPKRNAAGKTWKQHAAPHLSKALRTASRTWKPKSQRCNHNKVKHLQKQREQINRQIKAEKEKG